MEDDLNFYASGRQTQLFKHMDDNPKLRMVSTTQANRRRPQLLRQWEEDLNFSCKWKKIWTFQANRTQPDMFRQLEQDQNTT